MNIITTTHNSNFFYIRPDISLNRDSNDYFCPDKIKGITVAPFLYIRMDKAGKAVQERFAQRYYSSIGYGLNITATSLIDSRNPMSFLMANSLDNSTVVSQLYKPEELPLQKLADNPLLSENLSGISPFKIDSIITMFNKKIEEISVLASFKTGDLIAVEIAESRSIEIGSKLEFGELSFKIK